MNILDQIKQHTAEWLLHNHGVTLAPESLTLTPTKKEFTGDFTLVVFPLTRYTKTNPEALGSTLGTYLEGVIPYISGHNVIKGFLNLELSTQFWLDFIGSVSKTQHYGRAPRNYSKVLVESCSPNTNKPLHLGHIRNILLGWSVYKILDAAGYDVVRVQIINDRGVAICKSMLAWEKFGEGATPATAGVKGDHFVGEYYVLFEKKFREEYAKWQSLPEAESLFVSKAAEGQDKEAFFKAFKDTYFNEYSALGREAREMLRRWEANDPATVELWKQMNGWVYEGFKETFTSLGITYDKWYYESDTYLLGKDSIEKGLAEGVFYRQDDGSVWINLEDAGLDRKLVLRRDGTSVYITQDIGTADLRYQDFGAEKMIYVVADEQNYHFQVLFEIMKRMKAPYAGGLYHLSYGMVELPSGKMKSREGTVVDADDLIVEVMEEARANSLERETTAGLSDEEKDAIVRKIGLAALKFFLIKVHPQKRMIFDPKESVDLHGQTGPYIQNAYVRVQSVLRKHEAFQEGQSAGYTSLFPEEKELLVQLFQFPESIQEAAQAYDPSTIANFCFQLAKSYHRFYHERPILKAESPAAGAFRLQLSTAVANVLEMGMDLLGIEMPDKM